MTKKEDAWERLEEIKLDISQLNYLIKISRSEDATMALHRIVNLLNSEKKQLKKYYYGLI